jgi:hypothetical protein
VDRDDKKCLHRDHGGLLAVRSHLRANEGRKARIYPQLFRKGTPSINSSEVGPIGDVLVVVNIFCD